MWRKMRASSSTAQVWIDAALCSIFQSSLLITGKPSHLAEAEVFNHELVLISVGYNAGLSACPIRSADRWQVLPLTSRVRRLTDLRLCWQRDWRKENRPQYWSLGIWVTEMLRQLCIFGTDAAEHLSELCCCCIQRRDSDNMQRNT
jgi:hypothetical protein